jgi:hypothetical protein
MLQGTRTWASSMPYTTRFFWKVSFRTTASTSLDASLSADRSTTDHWQRRISSNKLRPSREAALKLSALRDTALSPTSSISRTWYARQKKLYSSEKTYMIISELYEWSDNQCDRIGRWLRYSIDWVPQEMIHDKERGIEGCGFARASGRD